MENIKTFETTSLDALKGAVRYFISQKRENHSIVNIISLSHSSINDQTSPTGQRFTAILVYTETIEYSKWDGEMF